MNEIPTAQPADFVADSQVEPTGEAGLYRSVLSDRWSAAYFPFGGFVAALALRAMQHELGHPSHRLRSATTVFVSPVEVGPVEIEVQRLRDGRRMSQLQATLRNVGSKEPGHTTVAVFGETREGFAFTDVEPPEALPPERCPGPSEPPPGHHRWNASFFDQVEVRRVRMNAPWETDWQAGRAEAVRWMRYRKTPRLADGRIDPLALFALADTIPPAIGQRLGPGYPFFLAPSCDLTVHLFDTTAADWLLLRTRVAHAGEGYASGSAEVWDPEGRLLARAAQLMYLRAGEAPEPRG